MILTQRLGLWFSLLLCTITLVLSLGMSNQMSHQHTEILWDTWGVPHIFAPDLEQVLTGFGYAQMHSHGNLILRLYGQSRGRAAEYWGEDYLPSDRYVHQMGIPERAQQWYRSQTPQMRRYLDAFAGGMNRYGQEHPQLLADSLKVVFPLTGVDVLAHLQRVIHFQFLSPPVRNSRLPQGSNGWAIAPSRSQSQNALLLANPHLPWQDFYLWYEAHWETPQTKLYGAALVGMPMLAIAFNQHLGWTATVNTYNGRTFYELNLAGEGYQWEGGVRPFDRVEKHLKIKQPDGHFRTESLIVERSLHGVILEKNDQKAIALKVAGLDRPHILAQFLQMAEARNFRQFQQAISQLQLPLFNLLYADQSGNIAYIFNALIPQHSQGNWEDWKKTIPGHQANTLWTHYHPYQDLPQLLNPATGWLQNTNDPPWTSTFPPLLQPEDYPAYFAPNSLTGALNIFRTQRSLKMLLNSPSWTLQQMIEAKFSSHLELADRLLDDLINAAQDSPRPLIQQAVNILSHWDRQANANSKGAALFAMWFLSMNQQSLFSTPWNPADPLNTPHGLSNPQQAVSILENSTLQLKLACGKIDVEWGDCVRLKHGSLERPASGASGQLGSFSVLDISPIAGQKFQVVGGDGYMAAIEFSQPLRAKVLNPYGNATQPHSPHRGDQIPLYAQQEMRPLWWTRSEIEDHLEERQELP
ncbi:acylase [Spirulina subsalsa]|uniref:acylase n=1 Tax=Spirulina subsalsa TaxID=54311 RepID=UPI0004752EFD|nr:acylase [Spirulina subsalsa]